MKVLVKNITDLVDDTLTITQRGLLITALLLRDKNPKYTLAKFKLAVKIKDHTEDLIKLHEKKWIEWSGYATAIKSLDKKQEDPLVIEIIDFMNQLYGRKFDSSSSATTTPLRARLKEHSIESIKLVIANRYAEWKDDSMMSKYLNPTTIFRPSKFDKYLEEAQRTHQGEAFVAAQRVNLNEGDEITFAISNSLIDKDVYAIKTYENDSEGRRSASGIYSKVYGSTLKKMIKVQQNRIELGDSKEFVYIYQKQ